ncbi:MAG TPA: DUF1552 domain-containing protein [Polyangiales bacterium]|jgi:hypothetical protein|nr:DUF1552 domain-containing protein [Polyangiales bacterium]
MKVSRRRFGAMVGGATIGAALLPQWMKLVRAQSAEAPVRFLAVRAPHGVERDYWIPRPTGGGEPPSADMALMELTFEYDKSILGALTPWREKITVLDGLDTQIVKGNQLTGPSWESKPTRGTYGNHGHNEQGTILTGAQPPGNRDSGNYDGHPSLDFYLHGRLPAPALLTASVEDTGLPWKNMSYDENGASRTPTSDPREVFRQAFPADFMPPKAGTPAVDYSAGEQLIQAYGDGALMKLRDKLVGKERDKIDRHMAAMAQLFKNGGSGSLPAGMCMTSGADVPTRDGSVQQATDVEDVTRAHARVIAQAFACGRARNATLQILNDYPNWHSHLPEVQAAISSLYDASTFRYHENLVHDYWKDGFGDARRAAYTAGLRWNAALFAIVLEELDGLVDPLDPKGGSILDNTIVFSHSEFGHGGHDFQETRQPAIIAGGGGKVLKLGRYLRLRTIENDERVAHNHLLVSIAHAVGVTDIDYFGDRDFAGNSFYTGPLAPLMV